MSGEPIRPLYTEADLPADPEPRSGCRAISVHARRLPVDVPRPPVDDAPVRRVRDRGGDQRALPLPARARSDGPLDRVRHAVADGPRLRSSRGRWARWGARASAIDTVEDMETLFDGIPLGDVSVSMTINAPAAIMLAFYVVAAERRGVRPSSSRRTIQTDILKEYIAQKEWCFPVDPAMRLVRDMIEWCAGHMPRWHPISISGYHIREAGSTAAQELAFTLKDGLTYVEQAVARGLDVDEFAPRLSFFFNAHIDFFEEIAKYRAARRIWARELRDTFGAQNRAVLADALPHPDGGRVADRAAAAEQHRADGDRGARGRARRDPVAAHQQLRRGAGAADRGGGAGRAPHPADHRRGDRRGEHDRPAGRLLLRRGADRPDGGAGLRVLRQDRRARRDGRGGQARVPAARDRRRGVRAISRRSRPDAHGRRRQRVHRGRRRRRRRSCASIPRSRASRSSG